MEVRWKIILILAHVFILSQLLLLRASTVSSSKTIHLPPGTADELHVGCLQQQNNYSRFIHLSINATSPYKCAQACAQKELPLAATFNDTKCHCANEALIAHVNNESCAGLSGESTLQVYNTSFFMVAFAELYQELMFTVFPPKITEVNSTAGNLSSYSLDFGDRRANSALHDKIIYRYASTGEFNVTLFASQANSTKLISFRSVKVFAPLRVNNMTCPASSPGQNVLCTLHGTSGSGVTLRVEMESADQNATLTVPDSPRVVLGTDEFLPFKESHPREVGAGTYLLQSREFWADTFLEAWELYAVQSGRIRLQVYRAQWNQTICNTTTHLLSSCQDMAPSNGSCNRVCFSVEYDKQSQPISSCAHMLANYSIVHTLDVDLTVGYNLIIIPEEQRLTSKIGDIVAFQRNSSGAVLQRITDGQSPGVYYYSQEQPSSTPSVFLNDLKALNFSFRLYVHGSVTATALLNVSCMHDVGIYHLKVVFTNPISSNDNRKPVEIQSNITVQNPIMEVPETTPIFIAVNVSRNITLTIRQGTNITCEWKMSASSFLKRQSHYIENNTTTEGVTCQMEFSGLPRAADTSITITFYAFNLISKKRTIIEICVREVIKGLKVEMCRLNSFAYDNAHTCFNASVVKGTNIKCKWYFKKGLDMDQIRTNRISKRIYRALTPVGETNVTVHCYNRVPEDERVIFPVRIIPNPLSIDVPVKVAVNATVKINCQITWPHGTPDKFFENQGLTGQKGTNIAELPRLTVSVYSSRSSGNGSVTLVTIFRGLRSKHEIKCKADQFPELNLVQTITSLFPVRGVSISTQCPFRFEVGTSCKFQVSIRKEDHASFLWRVTENGSHPLEFTKRTIIHQFSSLGKVRVSINVSNDVSWRTKTIYFIAVHSVFLLRSAELRHATSGFIGHTIAFSVARLDQPSLCRFFWNWDDTSTSKEAGPYTTHTYFKPGRYNVSVNISTGINNILLFSAVTVHGPIKGLQIRDIELGSSKVLIVRFEILQGHNVTYAVNFGDISETTTGFASQLPHLKTLTHQYKKPGTYLLSISVNNVVGPNSSVERSVQITESPCIINELRVIGAGEDSDHPPEIRQEYEYSLYSSLKINCSSAQNLNYEWKVEHVLSDSETVIVPFPKEQVSSDSLSIAAQSLRGGLYKFTLTFTATPLGISRSSIGFLRVLAPKLLATIDCGSERVMPWNEAIVLNGSGSRDPNDMDSSSTSSFLSFEWFCNFHRDVSCFEGDINNTQPVLRFPPKFLDSNTTYQFVLLVTKESREAEASQIITVRDGNFVPLCIRCMENCARKLTASQELVLRSEGCLNKNETVRTCRWELHGPPPHRKISRGSVNSQLIRVAYSSLFKVNPGTLDSNETYTIIFKDENSSLSSRYSILTDMPPEGGSCSVSPSEGFVIETQFRINCRGWEDEDSPLLYEFFLGDPTSGPMLLFYGWLPYSDGLFLPPGRKDNNYYVELFVNIRDVLGSYNTVTLKVKVKNFSPTAGPVSSILKGMVSGPNSMLDQLLVSGEFRQAIQLLNTVITVLNQDSSPVTTTDSADTENRIEVRGRVIQDLSRMCCSSHRGIRQALVGLLQATRVTTELSPNALENGANGLSKMAETLVGKFRWVRADNPTRDILNGLSHVIEGSVTTSNQAKLEQGSSEIKDWVDDKNEARNKDQLGKSEKATNKSLEGIDYAAHKLLNYKLRGDSPSHVTSGLMTLTVTRQSPRDITNAALNGEKVNFQIPSEVKNVKLGQVAVVNTKVVTMLQNPFISSSAVPMDAPVSSLELLETSGKKIDIQNLTEPVSVFLRVNQSKNSDLDIITDVISLYNEIMFYKFEAGNENSLYFRINCSGILRPEEMLLVMGKRNSKPSNENFDVSWSLSSCNGTITKLLTRKYLNNSAGFYLGLLLQEGNTTNGSTAASTIKFNVVVKSIGCYYWNENQQAWKTDGCEVGTQTTLDSIHCECTHLTWFGSRVFVPPNKLNLDEIKVLIVDPSNYVPVITVLSITCGLYLLALIWARREDRKDIQKIGASLSPSNKLGDTHAYEVIISTGMRRHAGTTANVAMTMTGERGESHAFLLKNSHCATLARGSVNTVLVTTSETLGELSYIRVWHDNFGDDPAWYLKQLCIREIATDRVWHFVCERWLAIDEGDGLIDRILTVTSHKEMKEFRRLFLTKMYKDLTDSHLWFSVFWRPPQSPFTRVQRVSCCFSLLLCTMMANAMWYEADKGRYTAVQLASLEFSWEQVFIGVCSSLIVFPVNLILVQIFRHCGRRPARKLFCKSRGRASSTRTVISRVQSASGESSCHGPGRSVNRYQRLNFVSPSVSPTYSSLSISELRLMSAKRLAHLPALFPPLIGAPNFTDSSSDVRKLLQSDSRACSPTEATAISHEEASSKGKQLPWWFVYVGWVLVIITSLVAGSVTLLYGIQFGLQKSTQWLLSMFFSVTQDIFVSQPLKVVGLAVFFALIFKKTNKVKLSPSSVEHYSHHHFETTGSNLKEEGAVAPTVNVPPENILQLARGKAAKERAMHAILLDFGTFILFTVFVLLIAYGIRDQDSFHQNNAVVKVALSHSFNRQSEGFRPHIFTEIIRPRDLWDWTEKVLLPTLYNVPSYLYTGKAPKFMEGETGLVVGVARLRQHRARKDSCSVAPMVKDIFSRCVEEYDSTTEDNQAYNEGWELGLNNTGPQELSSALSPWRYSSANELKGYPYKGKVTTYSGGGYVLELSHIYYKALRQIKSARSSLWLDRYTRSVFVEFSLYNPNSNLFCAVTFLLERPATGGLIPRVDVVAYRLYRYVGDFQLFILACEVLFVVFVLYFTYREAKKIYKTRRVYLTEGTNLLELAMLILCWIAIGYYFVWLGLRKWTLNLYHKNPTKFISFQYLSAWELLFEGVVGVTVFVTCLKFIKLFRFNRRIFLLSWTLRQASAELLPYLIVFMINFLAFALIYHVLLVGEYDSFSTLIGSMQKLLSALLGEFNVAEMTSVYRVVTAGIFILYMIITNFLLLNVLIVIIIESFSVVKQKNDEMENEFELLEYVMGRVGEVLGIRTLNKTVDQEPFAYSNKGIENEESLSPCRNTRKVERVNIAKRLEQALDKLDAQLDKMQDTANDDDMLCFYVSRRYTDTIFCNDNLTVNRSGFGS
ncbi:polycystin-1-like protein 2 [Montipora capricornis]|uniref:polycystin-1-like protein 2 n=1 Tax=Montipora capricornis TaxID=246305 RepID=UPI0035F11C88